MRQASFCTLIMVFLTVGLAAMTPRRSRETGRQPKAETTAGPEVQRFVRDALQDRLVAGDIPDIHLAGGQTAKRLYVRADMPVSKMKLTAEALPQLPGVVLKLVSLSEAGELVARTGETVAFVTVDRVHLGDREATVWLGADFVAPERPGVIKMCCCEGEARFIRREGRWVFEKWGLLRCA